MTDLSIEELYEIPIEKLNLPVKAMNACFRLGLSAVGDCVDALEAEMTRDSMYSSGWKSMIVFRNDVLPALIEQGYWTAPLNSRAFAPEIINELKQKLSEKGYLPE